MLDQLYISLSCETSDRQLSAVTRRPYRLGDSVLSILFRSGLVAGAQHKEIRSTSAVKRNKRISFHVLLEYHSNSLVWCSTMQ